MSGKSSSVLKVGDEVAAALKIRQALQEHADDPALILDTIEGETSLHEALGVVHREILDNDVIIKGCKAVEKEMSERRQRHETLNERLRNIILAALDKADVPTVKTPTGTLTKKATAPRLEVTDESLIPARFWKPADPVLDREALNAAHAAGEDIPGTQMTNGGIGLQIRKA